MGKAGGERGIEISGQVHGNGSERGALCFEVARGGDNESRPVAGWGVVDGEGATLCPSLPRGIRGCAHAKAIYAWACTRAQLGSAQRG